LSSLFGNTVTSSGTITAPGGRVEIFGDRIGLLENAKIDVSAVGGGGTVLIGGDVQGQGQVPNATSTFIGKNVTINADAINNGNGGQVIIWSDGSTRFYGNVSARGGVNSGNGGFVEVSGQQFLDYNGLVNTSATNGTIGTLLLDPTNIEIVAESAETNDVLDTDTFDDADIGSDGDTKVDANALNFSIADVTLQATENITFTAPVFMLFPGVGLNAQAGNSIVVNNQIVTNGGQIQLNADRGDINLNSVIVSTGFTAQAGNDIFINSQMATNGGDISLKAGRNVAVNSGELLTTPLLAPGNAGNISITATDSVELVNGASLLALPRDVGAGGNISISTKNFTLRNQGNVFTQSSASETAGSIKVNASETINIAEESRIIAAGFGSATGSNLEIETGNLNIEDGGWISILSQSQDTAGNLTINAKNSINISRGSNQLTGISTQNIETQSGGNLSLVTGQLLIQDSGIVTTNADQGKAGNLTIQARESVDVINKGLISTSAISNGAAAGNLTIETKNLNLQNQALVVSGGIDYTNPSGNMTIRAQDSVNVSTASQISTSAIGFGQAAELSIFTDTLTISDRGGVTSQSAGTGNAGNLKVYADSSVNLIRGGILSTSSFGAGSGGDLYIETRNVNIIDNTSLISTTSSDAASLNQALQNSGQTVLGDFLSLLPDGSVQFLLDSINASAESETQGNSGNLTIRATETVNIANTGGVSTAATGKASGGALVIDTQKLTLQNQSNIFTNTIGSGNAGLLNIWATDSVEAAGNSKIYTLADTGSTGNGGNIFIQTGRLAITDRADLSSATVGQGQGGDIQLQANSLLLTNSGRVNSLSEGTGNAGNILINLRDRLQANQGEIKATSIQAGGGDITINARDIRLRDSSEISTSVFNGTGGGGNIDIQSQILIALEDSDILANADAGPGGDITIDAPAFVAQFFQLDRNPGDFAQFRGNGRVDISAASNLGESGEVVINSIDPTRSLTALPEVPVTSEITEACYSPTQTQSKFEITGRGGLPTNPRDVLTTDTVQVDWVRLKPRGQNKPKDYRLGSGGAREQRSRGEKITPVILHREGNNQIPKPIVEATGWIMNGKGEVTLIGHTPTVQPDSSWKQQPTCNAVELTIE
jgi:large exoprotein involved in heme utilization and adhesion